MTLALFLALLLAVVVLFLGLGAVIEGGWDNFVRSVRQSWRSGRGL